MTSLFGKSQEGKSIDAFVNNKNILNCEERGEADYEESDDWWDSDEEPCTPSQQIDPAEFEVSYICECICTSNLHIKPINSRRKMMKHFSFICSVRLKGTAFHKLMQ